MSKEQNESHGSVREVVAIGLGVCFSLIGLLLPIAGVTQYGSGSVLMAVGLGIPAGFFIGAFCGLLLSWMVRLGPGDARNQRSMGPQLVGRPCVFCNRPIGSITEGDFCSECNRPAHTRCLTVESLGKGLHCPKCGAEN